MREARAAGDRVLRRAERARDADAARGVEVDVSDSDLEHWHDVRKAAKAARYAYEAIDRHPEAQVADDRARWKEIAESLGEVQDDAVVEAALEEFARDATESESHALARRLHARIRNHRDSALADARDAVGDATRYVSSEGD